MSGATLISIAFHNFSDVTDFSWLWLKWSNDINEYVIWIHKQCSDILAFVKITSPQVEDFIAGSTSFVLETQDSVIGGLSKWVDNTPDPLHTYLGLGGLALAGYEGLVDFDPALNVTKRPLIQSAVSVAESLN